MSHPFELMRDALMNSYKHRPSPGTVCTACGARNRTFAFHLVEYAQPSDQTLACRFVAMSESCGMIRGTFAFCDACAPACKKCGLPRVTARVRASFRSLVSTE